LPFTDRQRISAAHGPTGRAPAIAEFLASREATRSPAAYIAPTAGALSADEEARRISRLKLKAAPSWDESMRGLWAKPVAALGVSLGSKPSPASPVWESVWGNRRLSYLIR